MPLLTASYMLRDVTPRCRTQLEHVGKEALVLAASLEAKVEACRLRAGAIDLAAVDVVAPQGKVITQWYVV
jgi:hypothetical protein